MQNRPMELIDRYVESVRRHFTITSLISVFGAIASTYLLMGRVNLIVLIIIGSSFGLWGSIIVGTVDLFIVPKFRINLKRER